MTAFRRLPPLATLRVFEAVARHLNFTRAGDELGMTQSAVSHQVKQLEEWLGVDLLRRTTRSAVLTDAGAAIAETMQEVFSRIGRTLDAVERSCDQGTLSVSSLTSFGQRWLTPRLADFHRVAPDLAVHVELSGRLVDFRRELFDVGIRSGATGVVWPGLVTHELFPFLLTPMMTPAMAARLGPNPDPGMLRDLPLISSKQAALREARHAGQQTWLDWFAAAGSPVTELPRMRLEFETQALTYHAVTGELGVGLMTPWVFRHELATGALVAPFSAMLDNNLRCYLVYAEERQAQAKIVTFREWLLPAVAAYGAAPAAGQ